MRSSRSRAGSTAAAVFDAPMPTPADPEGADWKQCWPDAPEDASLLAPATTGEDGCDPYEGVDPDVLAGTVWPPVGLLGQVAPGPLLATLVAEVDPTSVSSCPDELLVDLAAAAARMSAWASAVELQATNELTDRVVTWPGVRVGPDVHHVGAVQMAAAEIGPALNLSPAAATGRVHLAADLHRLPATRSALAAGVIDLSKARMTVEQLRGLTDPQASAVESRVIGAEHQRVAQGRGRTYSELRRALHRAALKVNPDAFTDAHQDAVGRRQFRIYPLGPDEPGVGALTLTHRAETLARADAYVHALAKAAIEADQPGSVRTMDQACADVAMDLLTGHSLQAAFGHETENTSNGSDQPTAVPPRLAGPSVHVVVSAATLAGADDETGWLAGYGPIPAELARRIAADPTATWRRLLTDPRTGRYDELSVTSYQVPAGMARHARTRDRTCRFPGCHRPATQSQLDHRIPWPTGPTSAANLQTLCRTHHRIKTHTRTRTEIDPDTGDTIVTLPSGHTWRRPPDPVLARPEPPPPPPTPLIDPADDIPPF